MRAEVLFFADELDGAIKVELNINFKLHDYKFIDSFREKEGPEAKFLYEKVKIEVYKGKRIFCWNSTFQCSMFKVNESLSLPIAIMIISK